LTQDIEEERELLQLASSAGLSCMYDATRSSYVDWRNKILTLAQLLKEHELGKTIRSDSGNRLCRYTTSNKTFSN
jgi:hypothetical protein